MIYARNLKTRVILYRCLRGLNKFIWLINRFLANRHFPGPKNVFGLQGWYHDPRPEASHRNALSAINTSRTAATMVCGTAVLCKIWGSPVRRNCLEISIKVELFSDQVKAGRPRPIPESHDRFLLLFTALEQHGRKSAWDTQGIWKLEWFCIDLYEGKFKIHAL